MHCKHCKEQSMVKSLIMPVLHEIDQEYARCFIKKDLFDQLLDQDYEKCTHERAGAPSHHHHMVDQDDQHPGCKCSKIDCLKLYCQCFAKGRLCNKNCICVGCHNHSENQHEIYHAKQVANFRNPGYFEGVPAFVPAKRCTCKKSSCRKNYCQCYRAGVKCGHLCQCLDCKNGIQCSQHEMQPEKQQWNQLYERVQISSTC